MVNVLPALVTPYAMITAEGWRSAKKSSTCIVDKWIETQHKSSLNRRKAIFATAGSDRMVVNHLFLEGYINGSMIV